MMSSNSGLDLGLRSQNCENLLCRSHWFSTSGGIWSSDWSSPWPFGGFLEVILRLIPFFGWFPGYPGRRNRQPEGGFGR